MSDQTEQLPGEAEAWPMPSQDVLRELEPPALGWSAGDWPLSPQAHRTVTQ